MMAETQLKGPIDVEIVRMRSGREKLLLNNFDVSTITTKYEIRSQPASLKELVVTIPIGRLTVRDEQIDVTAIGCEKQYL